MTGRFWMCVVIGLVLLVPCAGVGWHLAYYRGLLPVRQIGWWVARVALPLMRSTSWSRRAATIFMNNTAVLAMVVGLGRWEAGGYAGVAALGLSMGMGLRLLSDAVDRIPFPGAGSSRSLRRRVSLGIALNMLEPPAIAAVLGLSIGRHIIPVETEQVWMVYVVYIMPALAVAAGGESLWMGAGRSGDRSDLPD